MQDDEQGEKKRFAPVLKQLRMRTVQEMVIPHDARRHERRIPWLSLSGRWLEQAGFTPGMQVVIQVRPGELVIKPAAYTPTGEP